MSNHDHSQSHDHSHDHHEGLAEMLDLDAEIFAPALRDVYDDIERAADADVRSILDIGAGTGTGTFGLLQHFTDAQVIAIDASAGMLEHLERRAAQLGLADRVTTREVDLDHGVPDLDPVDLVWASASLHHLADPDRTLTQITSVVRPGGLVAVAELNGLPRFIPAQAPGSEAELRAHELLAADRAVDMPTMGTDWGSRLAKAGLAVEQHRTISVPPVPAVPAVGRYAALCLTRIRGSVADRLGQHLQAFDALLDGGADDVRRRTDLQISAERWIWIARRPV